MADEARNLHPQRGQNVTLVSTIVTPDYVVQASDRLLTKNGKPFDPIANKSVLYRAEDAIATISYSGIAYINQTPTDEWLAQRLWGPPILRSFDNVRPARWTSGSRPNAWTLDTAIRELKRAIEGLPRKAINQGGLFLSIAAWRARRTWRYPECIVVGIKRPMNTTRCEVESLTLDLQGKRLVLYDITDRIFQSDLDSKLERFRSRKALTIGDAESVLVELIREKSQTDSVVGSNVMAMLLPKPNTGSVICRFNDATPHQARVTSSAGVIDIAVAHTPWIHGSHFLRAPQVFNFPKIEINLDGVPVELIGPNSKDKPPISIASATERPKP